MHPALKTIIERLPEMIAHELDAREKAIKDGKMVIRDAGPVDCDSIIAAKAALDRLYLELGCPGV
jgi:hypothetical protein